MLNLPIGILIDNFHLDTMTAIDKAAEYGAKGIQFFGKEDRDPTVLCGQKRKDFLKYVADKGLEICSICADVGGFKTPEMIEPHMEQTKRIMDMAVDMGVTIVTGHIGAIPPEFAHPRYSMMRDAMARVAEYAESIGAYYAIETGPETSWTLKGFLTDIGSNHLGVNLDPANLVMITGENPASAVRNLGSWIIHTHVKDGRQNWYVDPDIAYGHVPDSENLRAGHRTQTPIGEGSVPWKEYLQALKDIRYHGYLTIEREGGDDRPAEILCAYNTLVELIKTV